MEALHSKSLFMIEALVHFDANLKVLCFGDCCRISLRGVLQDVRRDLLLDEPLAIALDNLQSFSQPEINLKFLIDF